MNHIFGLCDSHSFETIDITGGAPELNPKILFLLQGVVSKAPKVILRSNLTLIAEPRYRDILDFCKANRVTIIGSLPSSNARQTDGLRGEGIYDKIIGSLSVLNELGYGLQDSDLELDLVSNPAGAYIPANPKEIESRIKRELKKKHGISVHGVFTFANAPIGRFKHWLVQSKNYDLYMEKLRCQFNPMTLEGVMCRNILSVSWNGYLYDCDFNLALQIPLSGSVQHISEIKDLPANGTKIPVADHCFACTAGSGFT